MAKVTKFAIRPEPLTVVHEESGYQLHRADGSLHSTHATEPESTAAVIRLSNQLRDAADEAEVVCDLCSETTPLWDSTDSTHWLAITRSGRVCPGCVEMLEEEAREVVPVPDLSGTIERARTELRACGALVGEGENEDIGW